MYKDWTTMSREEKGNVIGKVISLFECDEKITKIANEYVELPYELVHGILMKYLEMIEELDEKAKTL